MTDSKLSDENLALHFSARSAPAESTGSCPAPQDVFAAATGEASTEQRLQVVDHLTDCPRCAEDWRLAVAFDEGATTQRAQNAIQLQGSPGGVSRLPRKQSRSWMALAATVVLSAGVLITVEPWEVKHDPVYRGGDQVSTAVELMPVATLSREEFELRWTTLVPGHACDVRVYDAEFNIIADESGITAGRLQLPSSALQQLPSGTQLFWQVTPTDSQGPSATGSFVLE